MNREARKTRELEGWYNRRLQEVAKRVEELCRLYADRPKELEEALRRYAEELKDWSREESARMLLRASRIDYNEWIKESGKISRETRKKLREAGTGNFFRSLQDAQVDLITSLPLEAAEKVHKIVEQANLSGQRFTAFVDDIDHLGQLSRSRAILIARTETSRARANFTQARAEATGSQFYRWHTSHDSRVREMHADLDGKIFSWNSPPVAGIGKGGEELRAHPGCIFNCRCTAERLFVGLNFDVSDLESSK